MERSREKELLITFITNNLKIEITLAVHKKDYF